MNPSDTANAKESVWAAVCCLTIILALVGGVGFASKLVLHHLAQTLPLWAGVVLGFRRSLATRWVALPMFWFWLILMGLVWLNLLGISHIVNGQFTPFEIAMTIVVGIASLVGIVMSSWLKSSLSFTSATAVFVMVAAIQWVCFEAGFWSPIALR